MRYLTYISRVHGILDKQTLYNCGRALFIRQSIDKIHFCDVNGNLLPSENCNYTLSRKNLKQSTIENENLLYNNTSVFYENAQFLEFWAPIFLTKPYSLNNAYTFYEQDLPNWETVGFLYIAIDKMQMRLEIKQLSIKMVLLFLLFFSISCFFMYYFAKKIVKPLSELVDKSKNSVDNNYPIDACIRINRQDEFMSIAGSINNLLESLREKEISIKLSQFALDKAKEEIICTRGDGKIVYVNNSTSLRIGYSYYELIDTDIKNLFIVESESQWNENWHSIKKNEIHNIQFFHITKDRNKFLAEAITSLYKFNGQEYIFWFIQDISFSRSMEKQIKSYKNQLIQSEKMINLGTIAASIVHEINNPNTCIMLNIPTIEKVWKNILPILDAHDEFNEDFSILGVPYAEVRDKFSKTCLNILQGSKRIERIVNDLKKYYKKENKENGKDKENIDLN
ncbi:MAG: PAS domain S-box protein, partial [Desulfobacterales bacterium]|nr:PAS domain S-box protein [Desulfobacterales bacterium]